MNTDHKPCLFCGEQDGGSSGSGCRAGDSPQGPAAQLCWRGAPSVSRPLSPKLVPEAELQGEQLKGPLAGAGVVQAEPLPTLQRGAPVGTERVCRCGHTRASYPHSILEFRRQKSPPRCPMALSQEGHMPPTPLRGGLGGRGGDPAPTCPQMCGPRCLALLPTKQSVRGDGLRLCKPEVCSRSSPPGSEGPGSPRAPFHVCDARCGCAGRSRAGLPPVPCSWVRVHVYVRACVRVYECTCI